MNKEAYLEGRNPLEIFIGSALAGGGGFAAMRLLKEIADASRPKQQAGENENSLTIDVPNPKAPKLAEDYNQVGLNPFNPEGLMKLFALIGGAPVGFMGAKKLYDTGKGKQMEGEINRANQKYIDTLASFNKQSNELATPAVDAFCEGIAADLNKLGFEGPAKSLGEVPSDALRQISDSFAQNDLGSKLLHGATFGMSGDIGNAWKAIFALAALGGTGAMVMADKKRSNAQQSQQFPSTVKINEV